MNRTPLENFYSDAEDSEEYSDSYSYSYSETEEDETEQEEEETGKEETE